LEEIAWGEPAAALTVAAHSVVADMIVRQGTDAQQRQWLERMAGGEVIACVAQAEDTPTKLQRSGSDWSLNGTKTWVTNARVAGLALVLARAERGAKAVLLPTDTRGYDVQQRATTLGLRPLEICAVELHDVAVSADAVLDDVDDLQNSHAGLLGAAAIAVGICQAALDHARAYADVREQFSAKLRQFEGIQFKLADMAIRTEAARALLASAAADPARSLPAMAKVFASESAMWVTTQAVQIFGGYGYMRDYPVEKLMRDAKATELMDGVNEIQRVSIALGLYE
jgi:alkylation response protein AidB-like acyl-CoA dehydrogenase